MKTHRLIFGFLAVLPWLDLRGNAWAQTDTALLPQDYKCGISLRYSGTSGVDYLAEDHFHEPLQNNRRTVYIKAATTISMFHNPLNVLAQAPASASIDGNGGENVWVGASGPDRIPGNADDGKIRYRFDGDLNEKRIMSNSVPPATSGAWAGTVLCPQYTAPISFSTAEYSAGLAVLGRTGNNGQPIANRDTYYHYGILDNSGDEWHALSIGDDDWEYARSGGRTYKEINWASDGKMQMFVVNPRTPCITVAETGNAHFYTTPAKVYFTPVIHPQTTYILPRAGTVTVTLTDIYGGVVQYRINGGTWTNNGTNTVALADSVFSAGTNTLEARYAATPTIIRSRTIVKNPAFPSAGEAHGDLMWGNSTEYAKITGRLATGRYASYWTKLQTQRSELYHNYWDSYGMQGHRRPWYGLDPIVGTKAFENAFVAEILGWDAKMSVDAPKTYAQYAKEMLLDNVLNLDGVGLELNSNQLPAPITDNRGAGYYVVNNVFSMAAGYDIIAAHYRSDQHANGITPIEDYFIRDQMAGFCVRNLQGYAKNGPELWNTAMSAGVMMIGLAMPDYDTVYFGTSGYNGTTLATKPWTPYPNFPETWKAIFTDVTVPGHAYPDRAYAFGPDRPDEAYKLLGNSGGQYGFWYGPNLGYWNLMHRCYFTITNLSALHSPKEWPVIHQAYLHSVTGQMRGSLGTSTTAAYQQMLPAINDRHPTVAGPGRQALIDRGAANIGSITSLIWFDDGGGTPSVASPVFSPAGGTYNTARTVTITSSTGGASIRYTTNGTTPTSTTGTVYSGPITMATTGALKAIAYNGVIAPSGVATANYIINPDVVVPPPPVIPGVRIQGGIKVGKNGLPFKR